MRMATTSKISVAPGLLQEAKLCFQRKLKLCNQHTVRPKISFSIFTKPHYLTSVPQPTPSMTKGQRVFHCMAGKGKKKQIAGTVIATMSGFFLLVQLIYKGKTNRCVPKGIAFPEKFNLTFTPNHLSNEDKVIEHLEKIVFPFVSEKREELSLPGNQKAVLIFDVFKLRREDGACSPPYSRQQPCFCPSKLN